MDSFEGAQRHEIYFLWNANPEQLGDQDTDRRADPF